MRKNQQETHGAGAAVPRALRGNQHNDHSTYLEVGGRNRETGARVVTEVSGVRAHGAEGEQRPSLVIKREPYHGAARVSGDKNKKPQKK